MCNPESGTIPYSEPAHRALIALRCAKNARPINSVLDDDYKLEVEMLQPGTKIPHPMTVQRDLLYIYEQASIAVKNYFLQLNSTVHLALDGWTSPLISSYLGLVVVWFDQGVIHRAILEFICLHQET
ncbi:hypothetical protein BYT27DRAFT_7217763 [Phlegmacium glaucopus]|nr:hypothetical protein BYT27DRAFT_7217763 [Phlegmacium glaucopus]